MSSSIARRNIQNAQHSTGPRTEAGKAKSSQNAVKFGIFCKSLLVAGEDPAELAQLRTGILTSFWPRNQMELELVEQIIAERWRTRRIRANEQKLLNQAVIEHKNDHDYQMLSYKPKQRVAYEIDLAKVMVDMGYPDNQELERLHRYEQRSNNLVLRCMNQLRQMQKGQAPEANEFTQALLDQELGIEQANLQNEPRTGVSNEEPEGEREQFAVAETEKRVNQDVATDEKTRIEPKSDPPKLAA